LSIACAAFLISSRQMASSKARRATPLQLMCLSFFIPRLRSSGTLIVIVPPRGPFTCIIYVLDICAQTMWPFGLFQPSSNHLTYSEA
jgi:hypothetical protein